MAEIEIGRRRGEELESLQILVLRDEWQRVAAVA